MNQPADTWKAWWTAGVRIVAVETWDEDAVRREAAALADLQQVPLWDWSRVNGLTRAGDGMAGQLTRDPDTLVDKLLAMPDGVVVAFDLWAEPLSSRAIRGLREFSARTAPVMLVATGYPGADPPAALTQSLVRTALGGPWSPRFHTWLTSADFSLAQHLRRQQAAAPGLTLVTPHGGWDCVGGLDNLKRWADQRRLALNPDSSLPFARGVLLYGIPGTGKSVSVRAWADDWRLPLLRLDWGGLMGRYVGDSERRLANALAAAERLSPVILWLDEIDKAFGGIQRDEDSGVSRRLVGTLLTWMQEHQQPVLLLATANDVTGLPAELLRPGRFDALFFVDLPGPAARRDIMAIHLAARFIPPDPAMLALAETLDQYSGADIAAVVQEAQFLAAQEGTSVTAEVLAHSAHTVIPWAKTLGEELESRRQWAKGRLRLA